MPNTNPDDIRRLARGLSSSVGDQIERVERDLDNIVSQAYWWDDDVKRTFEEEFNGLKDEVTGFRERVSFLRDKLEEKANQLESYQTF